MSTSSHYSKALQRKVITSLLITSAILVIVAVPVIMFDGLRLDIAHQLRLAPGHSAEKLASADDGATLVVLPLGEYSGVGQERYRYKAELIGRPVDDGTELSNIDTGATLTIPLTSLDFISADAEGENILFRGPTSETTDEQAILVNTVSMTAEILPVGQATPTIEGDWKTPIWAKTSGLCDRYSPEQKFVACFNRADAASYLAGDWQIDVQLYGDYKVVGPVYRGAGFLPMLGFAYHDTWLYFQNELGIWRIQIPASLLNQT